MDSSKIVVKILIPTNFSILTQSKLDVCTKNIIYSLGDCDLTKYSINLVFMNINPYDNFHAFKNCWDTWSNIPIPYTEKDYESGLSCDTSFLKFKKYNIFSSVHHINAKHNTKNTQYKWALLAEAIYNNIIESNDTDIFIFTSSNYLMWKRGCLMDSILRYEKYKKLPLYFPQNIWGTSNTSGESIKVDTDISNLTDESEIFIRTVALRQFLCRPTELLKFTRNDIFKYILKRDDDDIKVSDSNWDSGLEFQWKHASSPTDTRVSVKSPKQLFTTQLNDVYVNVISDASEEQFESPTDLIKIKHLKTKPNLAFLKQTDVPIVHLFESFMVSKGYELYDVPQVDFKSIKLPISSIDNTDDVEWDYGTKFNQLHDSFGYILKLLKTSYNINTVQSDLFDKINNLYDSLDNNANDIKNELDNIEPSIPYHESLDIINKMYNSKFNLNE